MNFEGNWMFEMDSESTEVIDNEKKIDDVYQQRTDLFMLAMKLAKKQGYRVGVRNKETAWPVLSISLPQGQIAIHAKKTEICETILNESEAENYDNHSDQDKHNRIHDFIRN